MSLQFKKHRKIKARKKKNKMESKIEYIEITPSANPFELIRDFNEEMVIGDPKSNNEDELGISAVVLGPSRSLLPKGSKKTSLARSMLMLLHTLWKRGWVG